MRELNQKFPWWFSGNYAKFPTTKIVAGRYSRTTCFVRTASTVHFEWRRAMWGRIQWVSSWRPSTPARFYRLFGKEGFGASAMPPLPRPVMSTTGFHIRSGPYDITPYDWDQYMNFGDRYMFR